ncbi:hypothetical protein GRF61_09025 [Azoarcus sp. TTM-91]|uniref:hypothetical protein n=1 Tax=Azoarcus sp. TTM-91 TaxID=2691581 RepID=UPI00145ECBB4|nr:hypothetical protein [Azoarcus sp. TTM-91]NMG34584.1 hypothetical protein [Azoarcus sp. TTM-91]
MRTLPALLAAAVIGSGLFATAAYAADAPAGACTARADEKKLAGAARSSFLKKCEKDANTMCSASATEKKLAGAAKASFVKKCVSDAVNGAAQ